MRSNFASTATRPARSTSNSSWNARRGGPGAAEAPIPTPSLCKSRSPIDTRSRQPLLREFLLHLASERGLADNTLLAYRRDLEDLEDHLIKQRRSLTTAKADDYLNYIRDQRRKGQSTKTIARRIAAMRVFLR